jgi:Actinobacteria/chloroflexi VLRF1 release factor
MENGRRADQRWLDISPERIDGWLESFAVRHGPTAATVDDRRETVTVRAADGSIAECHTPFPPLTPGGCSGADLAAHASADRTVGVLLVRLGGYAAGVFSGAQPRLVVSKVGSRLVHGRSAAGGTSQHRFARRREKQAREALEAAADCAVGIFGPVSGELDALVLGGDKRAMAALRDDVRLRPYFDVAVDRFLTVPDPRLAVLQGTPRLFRAVRVRLADTLAGREGPATETDSPDRSELG